MADVKISQLPASTTPLDGTEVLPIVQSATTKQVSVANLTAGRAVSALSLSLTNALPVTSGGTGIASADQGALLSATGANTFSATRTPTLGLAGTAAGTLGLSGVTSGVVTLATQNAAGTWTMKLPTTAGTNNYLLKTDGSGNTDWVNPTALGIDLDVGTTAITGGTTGRVLYDNAGVLGEYSSVPVSFGGTGLTSLTAGYIPYGNGTGAFGSSSGLFWDSANGRLGVGTSTPVTTFQVSGSTGTTFALSDTSASNGSYSNFLFRNTDDTGTPYNVASILGLTTASGGNGALTFYTSSSGSNTERMRIASDGSVGIGTSSPSSYGKLTVLDAQNGGIYGVSTNAGGYSFLQLVNSGTGGRSWQLATGGGSSAYGGNLAIYDATAGEIRLTLDASGNLGLGVTPSAWGGLNAFQLPDYGTIASKGTNLWTGSNFYYASGTNRYIVAGAATQYTQQSGAHYWFTAPSGTAGNAISFTQAMTLDASGNLGVGTTSPSEKIRVVGTSGVAQAGFGTSQNAIFINAFDNNHIYMTASAVNSTSFSIGSASNIPLIFLTNNTEVARIDSSGNLLVGTTSSPTSGTQCLTIETGTAATASPADTITIYSTDLSAGNTMLSLYTEGTPVNANATAAATHRIAIRVNGTVYYLLANTSA